MPINRTEAVQPRSGPGVAGGMPGVPSLDLGRSLSINMDFGRGQREQEALDWMQKVEEQRMKNAEKFAPTLNKIQEDAIASAARARVKAIEDNLPIMQRIAIAKSARAMEVEAGAFNTAMRAVEQAHRVNMDKTTMAQNLDASWKDVERQEKLERAVAIKGAMSAYQGTLSTLGLIRVDPELRSLASSVAKELGLEEPVAAAPASQPSDAYAAGRAVHDVSGKVADSAYEAGSNIMEGGRGFIAGALGMERRATGAESVRVEKAKNFESGEADKLAKSKADAAYKKDYAKYQAGQPKSMFKKSSEGDQTAIGAESLPPESKPTLASAMAKSESAAPANVKNVATSSALDSFTHKLLGRAAPFLQTSEGRANFMKAVSDGNITDEERRTLFGSMTDHDWSMMRMNLGVIAKTILASATPNPSGVSMASAELGDLSWLGAEDKQFASAIGEVKSALDPSSLKVLSAVGNRMLQYAIAAEVGTQSDINKRTNEIMSKMLPMKFGPAAQAVAQVGLNQESPGYTLANAMAESKARIVTLAIQTGDSQLAQRITDEVVSKMPRVAPMFQQALSESLQTMSAADPNFRKAAEAGGFGAEKIAELAKLTHEALPGSPISAWAEEIAGAYHQVGELRKAGQDEDAESLASMTMSKYYDEGKGVLKSGEGDETLEQSLVRKGAEPSFAHQQASEMGAFMRSMMTPSEPLIDAPTRYFMATMGQKAPTPVAEKPSVPQEKAEVPKAPGAAVEKVGAEVDANVSDLMSAPIEVKAPPSVSEATPQFPLPGARTPWSYNDTVNKYRSMAKKTAEDFKSQIAANQPAPQQPQQQQVANAGAQKPGASQTMGGGSAKGPTLAGAMQQKPYQPQLA